MSSREEMLSEYLKVLDEINQTTRIALETLQSNAATAQMIIEEIVNGSAEPNHSDFIADFFNEMTSEDTMIEVSHYSKESEEEVAARIYDQILKLENKEPMGVVISMPEHVDESKVMKLLNKKLYKKDETSTEDIEEEFPDEINFDNPLE